MIWVLLYLYLIGVLNDFMFAVSSEDVDLSDWKAHVNIAAWPITVPAAIIVALFFKDED
jgi:hypothetical protein